MNGSIGNGHARHTGANSSLKLLDMPVRDKKSTAKRMFQEDIALYLVSADGAQELVGWLTSTFAEQERELQCQEATQLPSGACRRS